MAWRGRAVLIGHVACIGLLAWLAPPGRAPVAFSVLAGLATLVLVGICRLKGEPPHWRWGGR